MSLISRTLVDATTKALAQVMEFRFPADGVLSRYFRENRQLGHRDRGFIAETVYAVLRRKRFLERLLIGAGGAIGPRRWVLAALVRIQGVSTRDLAEVLRKGEADWLTAIKQADATPASLGDALDLPDWLTEELLGQMDEEALRALAYGLNQPAPLDLRVNAMRMGRDDALAALRSAGLEAEPGRWSPVAIRLVGKPAIQKNELFLSGTVEVQDEGSQLLGLLLAPRRGEMVVDFCAGAGGKTLHLGAMMRSTGRLYAFDVSEKRLANLKPRAARAGLSNVHPVVLASEGDERVKRLAGKIDRVLVDAPCSGLGTLRRNPDLKWRQDPATVAEMVAKQLRILTRAATLVKSGGRLVYATCSILDRENRGVVEAFLAGHPEFCLEEAGALLSGQGVVMSVGPYLRLTPQEHGTDAFFAAALTRAA